MDENNTQHDSSVRFGYERRPPSHEIVDRRDRLDAGKTSAGNDKRQQWLLYFAALAIGFFQLGNQVVPQTHGIAKRLHGERVFPKPGIP